MGAHHWIFRENKYDIHNGIIKKYFDGRNLKKDYKNISFETQIDHDGFDADGPQSYLYDLIATWSFNGKTHKDVWHREYWFEGEDNKPYVL